MTTDRDENYDGDVLSDVEDSLCGADYILEQLTRADVDTYEQRVRIEDALRVIGDVRKSD